MVLFTASHAWILEGNRLVQWHVLALFHSWKCMETYGNVWKCMEMYGNVWKCMEMYYIVEHISISVHITNMSTMSTNIVDIIIRYYSSIYLYLNMHLKSFKCVYLFALVQACFPLFLSKRCPSPFCQARLCDCTVCTHHWPVSKS